MPNVYLHPKLLNGRTYLAPLVPPAADPVPSGTITIQTSDGGQNRRFAGTATNATSGSYTLVGSGGAANIGPVTFIVAGDAFDFNVLGIPAGTYTPTLTVSGAGGATATVSGAVAFTINGVSGGGSVGGVTPPIDVPVDPVAAPRFARPGGDLVKGAWQSSSGADLYVALDETNYDPSDFISTSIAATCEIALGPVADPGTSFGQVVRYEAHALDGGSLTVRLKQGSTVIASRFHATLPTAATIHELVLTANQCDSITNYRDLRVELEVA